MVKNKYKLNKDAMRYRIVLYICTALREIKEDKKKQKAMGIFGMFCIITWLFRYTFWGSNSMSTFDKFSLNIQIIFLYSIILGGLILFWGK